MKAVMVMGFFFFAVTSQVMYILSDSSTLNNTVCDLFFLVFRSDCALHAVVSPSILPTTITTTVM